MASMKSTLIIRSVLDLLPVAAEVHVAHYDPSLLYRSVAPWACIVDMIGYNVASYIGEPRGHVSIKIR